MKSFYIKLAILMAVWFIVLAAIIGGAVMQVLTLRSALVMGLFAGLIYVLALGTLVFSYIRSVRQAQ